MKEFSSNLFGKQFWIERGFLEAEADMAVIFMTSQRDYIESLRTELSAAKEMLKEAKEMAEFYDRTTIKEWLARTKEMLGEK